MTVILGRNAEALVVYLVPTDPFVAGIRRTDDVPWTDLPKLEFDTGQTWTAALVGGDTALARFDVVEADVAAVVAADPQRVRLTLGGLIWASGQIRVQTDA